MRRLVIIAAVIIIASCSSKTVAPSRSLAKARMPIIVAHEQSRAALQDATDLVQSDRFPVKIPADKMREIAEASNVAFVYYYAAIVALAEGRDANFMTFISTAQAEVDRAKSMLAEAVRALEF